MAHAMARFLGWQQNDPAGPSASPDFGGILPKAVPTAVLSPSPPASKDGKLQPRAKAVWSDANGFGASDGFNLAKWRAECQAEIEASPRRRRWMKPVAKPGRLTPLGEEEFTATFVQAVCSGAPGVQRGDVSFVQASKKLNAEELAVRKQAIRTETGNANRRLAVEWRNEREKVEKPETPGSPGSPSRSRNASKNNVDNEDAARRRRAMEVFARVKLSATAASIVHKIGPESTDEMNEQSDANGSLRRRVSVAVMGNISKRRRHARKVIRQRKRWKARVLELPDATRNIVKDAFDMYANKDDQKISPDLLWKALTLVGLRGPSQKERVAVDRVCYDTTIVLKREYGRFVRKVTNFDFELDQDSLADEPHASDAVSLDHMIDFEEFCAEVVPNVRRELSQVRQEMHFEEFQAVLQDCSSVFLDAHQFKRLALRLGIDDGLVRSAVQDLTVPCKLKAGCQETRASIVSVAPSSLQLKAGLTLDFYTVHDKLMALEELHNHQMHKRELEINAKEQLSDEAFWQFSGELVRLYDVFEAHDTEHLGYLSFNEVKFALNDLGLQPFRPRETEVLERLLHDCDIDNSETFTFNEVLALLARVRAHQRAVREARLRREFWRYVKAQEGFRVKIDPEFAPKVEEAPTEKGAFAAAFDAQQHSMNLIQDVVGVWQAAPGDRPDRCVDVNKVHGLLSVVGFLGKNPTERALVDLIIHSSCESTLSFVAFERLCQSICEGLAREEVQEQFADAETLGIVRSQIQRYQAAFDHMRTKDKAFICPHDIPKALGHLLPRPPKRDEVTRTLESLGYHHAATEISFGKFLRFLGVLLPTSVQLTQDMPFTLRSVSEKKLREILSLFPVSSDYVDSVVASDIPELVANFLAVRPHTDLREMTTPVGNIRQLVAFAQRRASTSLEKRRPTQLFVEKMEAHVLKGISK